MSGNTARSQFRVSSVSILDLLQLSSKLWIINWWHQSSCSPNWAHTRSFQQNQRQFCIHFQGRKHGSPEGAPSLENTNTLVHNQETTISLSTQTIKGFYDLFLFQFSQLSCVRCFYYSQCPLKTGFHFAGCNAHGSRVKIKTIESRNGTIL